MLALVVLGALLLGEGRAAAAPAVLWERCETGTAAGQCRIPRGIAVNSDNGRIFVADQSNRRVSEFTARGEFVKAWGWDVVASGPGEVGTGFEICVPQQGDSCKVGTTGSGTGQFGSLQGMAVDSEGNVYVVDRGLPSNQRVQKFDAEGNFLSMFGGNVNKTKVEEAAPEAQRNRCPVDPGDECQKGSEGTGSGEFGAWPVTGSFIAIDPTDKVYVGDENRIQRFDTDGVYQDEIAVPGATIQSLAADSSGNLYAIYSGAIHKLNPSGEVLPTSFEVPSPEAVAVDTAGHVFAFDAGDDPIFELDAAGKLVERFGGEDFNASTGLATNLCQGSEAPGNLYVSNSNLGDSFVRAYGTEPSGCLKAITGEATDIGETVATLSGEVNPKGEAVSKCFFEYGLTDEYGEEVPCAQSPAEIGEGFEPFAVDAAIADLEAGTIYHFRLVIEAGGEVERGSDETFKTLGPPVISGEHSAAITQTEATIKATVNPEGLATTCHFEYGIEALDQSTPDQEVGEDREGHEVSAELSGLEPGETYRWQISCVNVSGATEGAERAFTTYRPFSLGPCPNDALRSGDSAFLPDCRAYEMVTPVDKNGGDILRPAGVATGDTGGYAQSSPDGDKLTYASRTSFAGQPASFDVNQYIASRGGDGWGNEGIHPPVDGRPVGAILFGLLREFMAFTPDLCQAWLIDYQTPPPTADGQEGYANLYRRDNCDSGAGGLEALTPDPPPLSEGTSKETYVSNTSVQGVSEDGRHALFVANAALPHAPEAAPGTHAQIYDRFGGQVRLVSVLPGGEASTADAAVGSGWRRNLEGAVSEDGSRVYWTAGVNSGEGRIFLREHPEQEQSAQALGTARGSGEVFEGLEVILRDPEADEGEFEVGQLIVGNGIPAGTRITAVGATTLGLSQSATASGGSNLEAFGECTEAEKACTRPVSATDSALFWGAAADGSTALYAEGGKLYEFDLQGVREDVPPRLIAEDVEGVAGASEDLSHIYFVSDEALAGSGVNSNGDEAAEGEPNLYLAEGGETSFIGTLLERDVGQKEPGSLFQAYSVIDHRPFFRPTRVTPHGSRLVFQSRAPLTGFDNTDAEGNAAVEVFTYEAGSGELACASCNPSGARVQSEEMGTPYTSGGGTDVFAAAWIPTWEHSLHASNVLSADGRRIFFNSYDALLPRDTNGKMDVYEWEAPGRGTCSEADPSYFPQNGGCIYLISSGEGKLDSELWEASPDGDDVFFTTASSLFSGDPGLIDIYDARVGGGIPQPTEKASCEGEACQSPDPPPQFATPASGAHLGPGNLPDPRRSCARPARRAQGLSRRARRTRRVAKRMNRPRSARRMRGKSRRLAKRARKASNRAKRCRRARRGQAR